MSRVLPTNPVDAQKPELRLQSRINDLESRLGGLESSSVAEKVTSIPAAPYDGQVIFYQNTDMGNAGVIWQLRYRAAIGDANKWEYVGGAPLYAEVATSSTRTANTYGALASTTGPALLVPTSGIYIVHWGAMIEASGTTGWRGRMSYEGSDTAHVSAAGAGNAGGSAEGAVASRARTDTFGGGGTLTCTYKSDAGNSVAFAHRFMSLVPVRVGP